MKMKLPKIRISFNWKGFLLKTVIFIVAISLGVGIFNYFIMPNITGLRQVIPAPDVVGMEEAKARRLLSYFNLRMSIVGYMYHYLPEGVIVKQKPAPSHKIKEGRLIDVWISKGPERKVMPAVKNLPLQEGINILLEAGVNVDNIVEIDTTIVALSGKIRNTDPPAGTFIPENGSIVVYVYKYAKGIPDLTGLTLEEAMKVLSQEKIPLKNVLYADSTQSGVVLAQYPPAGKPINDADSVTITIGGEIE